MPVHYIPLSELDPKILFNQVGIIPYVINSNLAYPIFGVSGKVPTLTDFSGSLKRSSKDKTSNSKNIEINFQNDISILQDNASNFIFTKSCRTITIPSDDFYNNAYILYEENLSIKQEDRKYLKGVIFICISISAIEDSVEESFDQTENNLTNLCALFRESFIKEHKSNPLSPYCNFTHLVWMTQLNFIYLIRNTTYSDGEVDENNSQVRKPNPNGNIPLDPFLKNVYAIDENEYPIVSIYNEKAHVPQYLITYPEMDPFLRSLLTDAYEAKIDFFFTSIWETS